MRVSSTAAKILIVLAILALAMAAAPLTGCGGSAETAASQTQDTSASTMTTTTGTGSGSWSDSGKTTTSHSSSSGRTTAGSANSTAGTSPAPASPPTRPADVSTVKSALRNAAVAEEAYFTDHSTYTTSLLDLKANGFVPPDNVTLNIPSALSSGYCIEAVGAGVPDAWHMDSQEGQPLAGLCQ